MPLGQGISLVESGLMAVYEIFQFIHDSMRFDPFNEFTFPTKILAAHTGWFHV